MLKFFNRLEKTRNFVLLIFAVLMVASLIFFYAPTRGDLTGNLARSEETAATVASEAITIGEIYREKELNAQNSRGRPTPAKLILNDFIESRILRVEAARLGLTASDAEVAEAIREANKSPDGKPFDQKRYEQNAVDQAGSIAAYEESIRDNISAYKVRAFITAGVTASEEEVLKDYQKKNTKFDLTYASIGAPELAQKIVPTDQELRDYFEKNKQTYYINAAQKKIRYLFINTAKIGEKLPITDADLQAEYNNLPADKKIAGVLGQEIVLRIPKPEQDGEILQKANDLTAKLKQGTGSVSEEAFAQTAKGFSENPATAPLGGKLRGPVRENLNDPTDPYQRLLKMQPGQITEPISFKGRYFILRRGAEVPKSLADAKKEIEVSLRNRRAYAIAAELAQKVSDTLKQNKDVQATAQQFAAEANMKPAEMIKETGYVKPGDNIENIGNSQDFEASILPLENPQDVGDKTPIQNGFAVPMLVEKKEPRDAEFDEVKAQIVEAVKLEKANSQVEEIAKQIAEAAANADALSAAAAAKGFKIQEVKSHILGTPLGQGPSASSSEALEDALYAMKQTEVTKTPIKIGDNWYVVGITKREDANMDDYAKQRSNLMQQMLARKRGDVFEDYLAATRRKMEQAGSIKIYKEAMAKLEDPAPPIPELAQ